MRRLLAFLLLLAPTAAPAADHAIAMHGVPKYGPDYTHFGYVNPDAPKGGDLVRSRIGSFDSLNPFTVKGVPADGLSLTYQSLLQRSWDEPFTLYVLLAESVSMPEDRGSVTFSIRPGARFHDGSPVTVDDVVFSLETLRDSGRPNHRFYYREVVEVRRNGPRRVTFVFRPGGNRELPLIMGFMPILSKASWQGRRFDATTYDPILGTGPYRIEDVDPGRSITYRRIAGHWSETLPAARGQHNFDRIRYDYYRDASAAFEAFKAGRVDLRAEPDPQRWAIGYDFPAAKRGDIALLERPHGRPSGMRGFVFNTRRPLFADPRVRRALGQAFDFAWVNRTYFHDAYARTTSYFDNSQLAAKGPPSPAELALLAPFRESLPPALFETAYLPPGANPRGLRGALREARRDLAAAGWEIRDLRLVNRETGAPMRFEIMLARREDERLALAFARNLERLGVEVEIRTVDSAQYQDRLAAYDFDMIIHYWGLSLSPGNEQAFYWSSASATAEGTRNYPGIRQPAVDSLIGAITAAPDRAGLIAAVRALDRVLLWGDYVVPLYHLTSDRVAHWNKFGYPPAPPLYGFRPETWWHDAARAAAIDRR